MNTCQILSLVAIMTIFPAHLTLAQDESEIPLSFEPSGPQMYLRASALYGPVELDFDEFDDYWHYWPDDLEYEVDLENEPAVSIAVGWDSLEIEILQFGTDDVDHASNNKFDVAYAEADLDVLAIMFNGTVQYPLRSKMNAYVGAGIGLGFYEFEVFQRDLPGTSFIRDEEDDIGLGLQLMAGLAFEIDPHIDLYVGGRGFWIIGEDIVVEYLAVELGLKFYF